MHRTKFLFFVLLAFYACGAVFAQDEYLKNWDTVNQKLDYYNKKQTSVLYADFGKASDVTDEQCVYFSSDSTASITFEIKKDKIAGYSYSGPYTKVCSIIPKLAHLELTKIQSAAECWLGYSPDLLKETLPKNFIFSSTDKVIKVGPSASECIEFNVGTSSETTPSGATAPSKSYIKSVKVTGTYKVLKDYLYPLPESSESVKKIRRKN